MPAMGPPPPSLGGLVFVLTVLALFAAIPLLIAGAVIWVVFVYLKVTMVQFLAVTAMLVVAHRSWTAISRRYDETL